MADESSLGSIMDARDVVVTKKFGEGEIGGNIEVNQIGYLLLALLGSVTSSPASTGAYTHNFSLLNSNIIKTLTIGIKDPIE
jgi:hypothetical protein